MDIQNEIVSIKAEVKGTDIRSHIGGFVLHADRSR